MFNKFPLLSNIFESSSVTEHNVSFVCVNLWNFNQLWTTFLQGSISISMTLHQTTFCFVCTHLTSGEKEGDEVRRNYDVMEILKKTRFPQSRRLPWLEFSPDSILEHE